MARDALVSAEDLLQADLHDLKRIWDDLPLVYRDALACHPRTPPHLLWHAVKLGSEWIDRHGLPNSDIPRELVWELFLFQAFRLGYIDPRLAAQPSVEPAVLSVLTDLGDGGVRSKVAGHRNATEAVLTRLAFDPAAPVRRKATKRLRAGKTLRRFFKNVLPRRDGEDADPQKAPGRD